MMAAPRGEESWRLSALLAGVAAVPSAQDRAVTGVTLDSRSVHRGDVFLACAGVRGGGHAYIEQALALGASAVVYEGDDSRAAGFAPAAGGAPLIPVPHLARRAGEIAARFYGEPSRALRVTGVTGTNGKTSVSQFIAQALDRPDAPCGVIGTLGNGLYGQLQSGTHTTPDAVTVQSLLARMREAGARAVAMEVSSHALDQGRVNGVVFDTAIFTNLSRDHLDYHGDMESYGAAKRRLFDMPDLRAAVVNADDDFGRGLLVTLHPDIEAVSYGLIAPAPGHVRHVRGTVRRLGRDGMTLFISSPWGEGEVESALLGRFNAANLLAAAATLLAGGMPFLEVLDRLAVLKSVPGRMECFGGTGTLPLVVVDYAHTPDALEQVLAALREHCRGELWCVFGCGGDRDRGKRPLMGAVAGRLAGQVIVTDDNPRGEEPAAIAREILEGFADASRAIVLHDRAAAIAVACARAGADDVVLIAGKGHETYQITGAQTLPFSDQEQVRMCLGKRAS